MVELDLRAIRRTAIIMVTMLAGCNYNQTKGSGDGLSGGLQSGGRVPGYTEVFNTVLSTNCAGCHGSAGGVSVTTLPSVRANLGRIQDAVSARRMPPAGMPEGARQTLLQWLQAGAPENVVITTAPTPPVNPPPVPTPTPLALSANYSSLAPIFQRSCTPCHNAQGSARFLPLESYEDVTSTEVVDTEDPERSLLYEKIIPGNGRPPQMPPARSPFQALSTIETQTILTWIRNGVPR